MNVLQKTGEDKSVLQWGGLAGTLGGILYCMTHIDSAGEPLSGDRQSRKGRDPGRRWLRLAEPID